MNRTPFNPMPTPSVAPRRTLLQGGLVVLTASAWPRWARAADDGLALARRVHERPDGQDVTSVVTMTLSQEGSNPRERKMLVYRANDAKGVVSTLIRFTAPADIQGTGLLTVDASDGGTDQWIYLPAMQRVRRVDANRQGGRFVNSDYYFEDLKDRKPAADTHRVVGREKVGDVLCDVLESVPVQADNSVYLKRLSWIDPKSLLPLRLDFFEKRADQPSKRLLITRREQVQGYWTVLDSTLSDLETRHQTRLQVDKALYDRRLPASLFTSRALADERQEREVRP
ncbi:outer membrane lipoprotein-sorting protein [Hydrogenophaga sp.]|uniref:outer membrane lipoprotein-sorting protein n=1 Tax=Hydrogenophaga sp. TaxID=1904254 RepID=UPI00286DB6FF|nr:outer membrane lipoprotein-sorting protein [Hydrogenophaga sp.]